MELTTGEAADRLGVNTARVRALVGSGTLAARRVGSQWLIDAESVDRQARLTGCGATGRAMAIRVAWAAADLADGGAADWLTASERHRLRRRLADAADAARLERWLGARATRTLTYRAGERDLAELLADGRVVATGVSAAAAYRLGLGAAGSGDAYVSPDVAEDLVRTHYLLATEIGNLTLRLVEGDWHHATTRLLAGRRVAPRLVVGVDLAEARDTRTRRTGTDLLQAVLAGRGTGFACPGQAQVS